MKSNTLAIALAALLVGGVAVGAYHNNRDDVTTAGAERARDALDYAEVIDVLPVTEKAELFATVIGTEPVRETTTASSPRQVCEDVVVQERLPERDGNVGGTVAGAVIELVHLATLYHDDVMDEAQMRRGAPSANARWGNNIAILAGDYLFVVDNDAAVVALTRSAGRVRWVSPLEKHKDPNDRKSALVAWAGPVLAGGKLWLAGSHGVLLALDPADGRQLSRSKLPGATYLPPVVANNTLYVLSDNGTLSAYR